MFFTLFNYGLLAIFHVAFFDSASTVLPYFIALILIALITSRLIGIEGIAGAKVK